MFRVLRNPSILCRNKIFLSYIFIENSMLLRMFLWWTGMSEKMTELRTSRFKESGFSKMHLLNNRG
jgi:hypothetical protein